MDEKDTYRTIRKQAAGSFRDRGSKFLAFAYPVHSVEEAQGILENLRREYHDARHHCYAYRIGTANEALRAYDDGEPSNSAGQPILGQIRSFDLRFILVVVVRYFGGTLLGVGGLINAYRSAASDALCNAEIIVKTINIVMSIHFPYTAMSHVMHILDDEGLNILERDFTESCTIRTAIRKSLAEQVKSRLEELAEVKVFNSY